MKTFILLFALMLSGCATVVKEMSLECSKTKNEILTAATTAILREGMTVQQSDANIGLLRAESMPQATFTGVQTTLKYVWQIQVTNSGKIIATAQGVLGSGGGTYFDDETSQSHTWYWGVRNELAALCGNNVVFTQRK